MEFAPSARIPANDVDVRALFLLGARSLFAQALSGKTVGVFVNGSPHDKKC